MEEKVNFLESVMAKFSGNLSLDESGNEVFLKSGSIMLDAVISNGKGIPLNKFIQITSDSGLGKTSLILQVCKTAVATHGKKVLYIDTEGGINGEQLRSFGLSPYLGTSFFYIRCQKYVDVETAIEESLKDPDLVYIVIDSISALVSSTVLTESVEKAQVGINSRIQTNFLPKYRALIADSISKPTVFFINQNRTKINMTGWGGSSIVESGSRALAFYTDIKLKMEKESYIKEDRMTINGNEQVTVGVVNKLYAEKNRYNDPMIKAPIAILFGKGVSNLDAYRRALTLRGVLTMKGAGFYTLSLPGKEECKCRGEANVTKTLIKEHLDEIKEYIDATGGLPLITS